MSTPSPGPGPGVPPPPPYTPPAAYTPPPAAPPPRRRNPLVLLAGGVVLLCIGCVGISFLITAVAGPSVRATETAQAQVQGTAGVIAAATRAVEQAVAQQAAQTAAPAQTAAAEQAFAGAAQATAAAIATRDAEGLARATADTLATANAPTVTPQPSFGSTIPNLNDWTISLAKMESKKLLTWSSFGNQLAPSGLFWVIYVDAKNLKNTSRGLQGEIEWELVDDHDAHYAEISEANPLSVPEFVRLQGRDKLNSNVTPRAVTHPLLVFDVAADALPAQLIVKSGALLSSDQFTFDLTSK